jgi:hypothetical protein
VQQAMYSVTYCEVVMLECTEDASSMLSTVSQAEASIAKALCSESCCRA